VNPHPVTRLGETKEAEPDVLDEARNYAVLYIVFLAAGSFAVMFLPKITCEQGIYVFASAMSDTGLSIIDFVAYKAFSPTSYAWLLWILDIGMFFGRLEIMPIFFGISRLVVDPLEEIRLRRKRSKAKEA
jgi:Trk-type K+ transport system membrane component